MECCHWQHWLAQLGFKALSDLGLLRFRFPLLVHECEELFRVASLLHLNKLSRRLHYLILDCTTVNKQIGSGIHHSFVNKLVSAHLWVRTPERSHQSQTVRCSNKRSGYTLTGWHLGCGYKPTIISEDQGDSPVNRVQWRARLYRENSQGSARQVCCTHPRAPIATPDYGGEVKEDTHGEIKDLLIKRLRPQNDEDAELDDNENIRAYRERRRCERQIEDAEKGLEDMRILHADTVRSLETMTRDRNECYKNQPQAEMEVLCQ